MSAKRVNYTKVTPEGGDYVDARFDVFLDGEKIGEVTRDRGAHRRSYANSMLGYDTYSTTWAFEAPGYRTPYFREYKTRMDAVVGYLAEKTEMSYNEAREVVGKKGLF